MQFIAKICDLVLGHDIPIKNAICILIGLVSVIIFYFTETFGDIFLKHKAIGVEIASLVIFLLFFFVTFLLYTLLIEISRKLLQKNQRKNLENSKKGNQKQNLLSLTEWQRGFLMTAVANEKRQFQDYEIGLYRSAWENEVRVLIRKGILTYYTEAGVYEVNSEYFEAMKELMASENNL